MSNFKEKFFYLKAKKKQDFSLEEGTGFHSEKNYSCGNFVCFRNFLLGKSFYSSSSGIKKGKNFFVPKENSRKNGKNFFKRAEFFLLSSDKLKKYF